MDTRREFITENGLTLKEEAEILEASKEAEKGKNVTKTVSSEETMAYLDSLK